jgi:RNA polymerase sigma-70 factor (ECF subfamily)
VDRAGRDSKTGADNMGGGMPGVEVRSAAGVVFRVCNSFAVTRSLDRRPLACLAGRPCVNARSPVASSNRAGPVRPPPRRGGPRARRRGRACTLGHPAQIERRVLIAAPAERALDDHIPIVLAAQRGDREAFGELYTRFGPFIHAILLARVPPDVAADLAQDVFMHAWTMIGTLHTPAAFGGWIGVIARRRAIDYFRRRPLEVELDDRHANRDAPDVTLQAAEAIEAIRGLPEAYRETLLLRLLEGCSGPEIAELCGLTPDSVRVNLHRGFKLLRERLGEP